MESTLQIIKTKNWLLFLSNKNIFKARTLAVILIKLKLVLDILISGKITQHIYFGFKIQNLLHLIICRNYSRRRR